MGNTNRKKLLLIGFLFGITLLVWLGSSNNPEPKPKGPIQFIRLRPTKISNGEVTPTDVYRNDYFGIKNLYRSDSAALLRAVANHVCQKIDSINLQKFRLYIIEYYEYGPYLNDTILLQTERDVYQVANEPDAFVYWIIYDNGKLSEIKWHKTGNGREEQEIKVTNEVRRLFNQCHKHK